MSRHHIPLGKVLGIPIGLDYSWFVVFALFTWLLASRYYPHEFKDWPVTLYWVMGAVTVILLFASVLLHELGHSVVARGYGTPVRSITLFLFGGVAEIGAEPPNPPADLFIALAGPLASLILAVFFDVVQSLAAGIPPLLALAKYLTYINVALLLFNLIPGFPLDGGRVLRAILWSITGKMGQATLIAANVGRFFAYALIFVGVWQIFVGNALGGLWIAFIGWFLDIAASSQVHQMVFQGLLEGHKVSQAMSAQCAVVPADLTVQNLVDEHILSKGERCFLVNKGESPVGLITLHRLNEVPRDAWASTSAAQVMLPLDQLQRVDPGAGLWATMQKMDRDGVNQLPVTRDGHVIGMLSREDVIAFLRTLQELGTRPT